MSFYSIFLSVLISFLGITASSEAALLLASGGKSEYTLSLAHDAIPAERTAAAEFQKYFYEMTGATLPIAIEGEVPPEKPQIFIGGGQRVKDLIPSLRWGDLGNDGIIIHTSGQHLILAGGRPRGALYAVFEFLEKQGGCRWWTPEERTIPKREHFQIEPSLHETYTPVFHYREHYDGSVRRDPVFATILRENGHFQKQTEEWGGHYHLLGWVHTFSKLLPLERYFKDHPEWYSDPANGFLPCTSQSKMPMPQQTQPDLSNPEVLEELCKNALEWIAAHPEAGLISISQNDSSSYCRCERCMALIRKEKSPGAPLFQFVNAVARRVRAEHPGFLVETLAYNYSEKPPRTLKLEPNVVVRLGLVDADFGHPLVSQWNKASRANFDRWKEKAPRLYVWNYVTNFKQLMLPHPNWAGLGEDLRFFAENGVQGVFQQGDGYTDGVGDFVALRAWLLGKLLWNPAQDENALIDEFLMGYYGKGGIFLRQYLDLLQNAFLQEKRRLSTFNTDFSYLTPEFISRGLTLFDNALQAVSGDEEKMERIRRERLSLDYARLYVYEALLRKGKETAPLGLTDPTGAMEEFISTAQHFGIRNFTEKDSFEEMMPHLRAMVAPSVELPDFAKKFSRDKVVDLQPGNFLLNDRGKYSDLEHDEKASNNIAATIVGNTLQWGIHALLRQYIDETEPKRWHVYAMARVAATEHTLHGNAAAFQCGIYHRDRRESVAHIKVPMSDAGNREYRRVDLGIHRLEPGMYVWFAPVDDPAIKKIYVDRIILVQEGASKSQ